MHTWARRMLLPRFGPSRIEELTPITHGLADDLIDDFIDAGQADAAQDYAQHIPVRVIARKPGGLRHGVSAAAGTDMVVVLFSAELYQSLAVGRSCSHPRCVRFFREILITQPIGSTSGPTLDPSKVSGTGAAD